MERSRGRRSGCRLWPVRCVTHGSTRCASAAHSRRCSRSMPSLTSVGLVLVGAVRVRDRRDLDRRSLQLHLPVHPARLPVADHRLRAGGAAPLDGRLEPYPGPARRTDRADPACDDRTGTAGSAVASSTSRSPTRMSSTAGRTCCATCRSRCPSRLDDGGRRRNRGGQEHVGRDRRRAARPDAVDR